MKNLFLFIVFASTLFLSLAPHPVYVSNTEIDYKENEKKIEIAVRVFCEDLQTALSDMKGKSIEIGTEREHKNATKYIVEYFKKHLVFEINGKKREYTYVQREVVKEDFYSMWVLLKIEKLKRVKSIVLKNDLLIDLHATQQNIISFKRAGILSGKFTTHINKVNAQLM